MTEPIRGLYYYILVGEHGQIEAIRRSSRRKVPAPDGYIEVLDNAQTDLLGDDPRAVRWDGEKLILVDVVELSANTFTVKADGVDVAMVNIKRVPEHIDEVHLRVNGSKVRLKRGENLELTTTEAGSWDVVLDDVRLRGSPASVTIRAVEDEG